MILHSSQKLLPQQGIITASVSKSLQIIHCKSSGISTLLSTTAAGLGSGDGVLKIY